MAKKKPQTNIVSKDALETKHPLYATFSERAHLCLALYHGGSLIERDENYLLRHPFETEKQWNIRLKRATYRNFAAPVVDVFAAAIGEDRPERTLPERLKEMLPDVDKYGTTADAFFDETTRLTAAAGAQFVLVDMQAPAGQTVEEDKRAGRRQMPYFVRFDAHNVLDWSYGEDGKLDWVVLRERTYEARGPFKTPQAVTFFTVWTRKEWQRYKIDANNRASAIGGGPHPVGRVPLVPFLFEPTTAMTGYSCLDDVASLLVRVYRRDSELDKLLFDTAVPLMHMAGVSEDEAEGFVKSSSNGFVTSDAATLQYVEPQGTSYNALTQQITKDENSVREIALRMIRADSAVGQSADSKMLDKSQLDTQLARYATACASSEKNCWELAARWLGIEVKDDEISTPYNEDYDVEAVDTALTSVLMQMRANGDISRSALLRAPAIQGVLPEDFDAEEDKVQIENERREGPSPVTPSGAGLFRRGQPGGGPAQGV